MNYYVSVTQETSPICNVLYCRGTSLITYLSGRWWAYLSPGGATLTTFDIRLSSLFDRSRDSSSLRWHLFNRFDLIGILIVNYLVELKRIRSFLIFHFFQFFNWNSHLIYNCRPCHWLIESPVICLADISGIEVDLVQRPLFAIPRRPSSATSCRRASWVAVPACHLSRRSFRAPTTRATWPTATRTRTPTWRTTLTSSSRSRRGRGSWDVKFSARLASAIAASSSPSPTSVSCHPLPFIQQIYLFIRSKLFLKYQSDHCNCI